MNIRRLKPLKSVDPAPTPVANPAMLGRIHVLDSLRGIMAVIVMMGHFYLSLPPESQKANAWMMFTPVRYGPAFVVIFFMLSSFVLALPYRRPVPPTYAAFLLKRLCRLYIPFIIILGLAFLVYDIIGIDRAAADEMSVRLSGLTGDPGFTWLPYGRSLFMTGLWQDYIGDLSAWSLVYETRISLIFPLLILLCRRAWLGIAVMALIYVGVAMAQNTFAAYVSFPAAPSDYLSTWVSTLYFVPCFMAGILLVKYAEPILKFLADLSGFQRGLIWVAVAVNLAFMPDFDVRQPFTEFGAAAFLMLLLSSEKLARFSKAKVLQWLGRISYSTYLIHLPVMFVLRHYWEGQIAYSWIFTACIALTLPIATLTQRYIEVPSRLLGRRLALNP